MITGSSLRKPNKSVTIPFLGRQKIVEPLPRARLKRIEASFKHTHCQERTKTHNPTDLTKYKWPIDKYIIPKNQLTRFSEQSGCHAVAVAVDRSASYTGKVASKRKRFELLNNLFQHCKARLLVGNELVLWLQVPLLDNHEAFPAVS